MNLKDISQLTDEELLEEAQKIKPSPILDASMIGFFIGIIIYSVVVSSWGLVTLVPLFLIYLLLKKSKRYTALKKEIKRRRL
ncbi:MAG: FUSC family protein [Bacteroidetes bacterium]|jgi:hypothetical protein|nr:FUSC family protein [Bacteroidota bacterium]